MLSRLLPSKSDDDQTTKKSTTRTKRTAIKAAIKSLRRVVLSPHKDSTKKSMSKEVVQLSTSSATTPISQSVSTLLGNVAEEDVELPTEDLSATRLRQTSPATCSQRQAVRERRRVISATRLAPPSFLETDEDEEVRGHCSEDDDANTVFFGQDSTSSSELPTQEIEDRDAQFKGLNGATVPEELLRQIRDRDEQIKILRACNDYQQGEVTSLRKLTTLYIGKQRDSGVAEVQWQKANERSVALVEQWRDESEQRAAEVSTLQTQLMAAKVGEDVAREAYESLKAYTDDQPDFGPNLNSLQTKISGLEEENAHLSQALSEARDDYEVLAEHKTAEWIADPTDRDAFHIKPDEVRDLQQALDQSMQNHKTEFARSNKACKVVQEQEKEIKDLKAEKQLLQQRVDDLEKYDAARTIVEDHLSAVKALFAASSMLRSDSDLSEAIEDLLKKLTRARITSDTMGSLMRQTAELKTEQLLDQRKHQGAFNSKQKEVDDLKRQLHELETNSVENTMRVSEVEVELTTAKERIAALVEERDDWRQQCETKAFGEHEDVLYRAKENRAEMYKHKLSESYRQVELLQRDLVDVRGWTSEELDKTGLYLEQRDWYEAQVKGLEAEFAEELRGTQLVMPFRPNYLSATKEEKREMLVASSDDEVKQGGRRGKGYNRVRNEYLNTTPSDVAVLVMEGAEARKETARVQSQQRAEELAKYEPVQSPANPQDWGIIMPQIPVALAAMNHGDFDRASRAEMDGGIDQEYGSRGSWVTEGNDVEEELSFSMF